MHKLTWVGREEKRSGWNTFEGPKVSNSTDQLGNRKKHGRNGQVANSVATEADGSREGFWITFRI